MENEVGVVYLKGQDAYVNVNPISVTIARHNLEFHSAYRAVLKPLLGNQ